MNRSTKFLLTVTVATVLIAAPTLFKSDMSLGYDAAFAAKGGNGKGKGNGNGNSGGGTQSASAEAGGTGKTKSLTSQMGALNAAHASASAFAHANPRSRVGRIREAVVQTALASAAQATADAAAQGAIDASPDVATAQQLLTDARSALDTATDPATIPGLQQAVADAEKALADAQAAAVAADPTAVAAQAEAEAAQEAADAAWNAAANKTPVSDEVKAATEALVAGKIDLPSVSQPEAPSE